MIPIQCPKCNRTGNVPPDRLNARLVCKGCMSVFHMDNGGRMVLGEPGIPAKAARAHISAPAVEVNLAETWQNLPKPAKIGVPTFALLLAGWMIFPTGPSRAHEANAEAVGYALLNGDRAEVVTLATPESADAAGQWFDLMRTSMAGKSSESTGANLVQASLLDGNADRDSGLSMIVALSGSNGAISFTLPLVKNGGSWKFDGSKSLDEAKKLNASVQIAAKKK